jgi:hypothetical protein
MTTHEVLVHDLAHEMKKKTNYKKIWGECLEVTGIGMHIKVT